MRELFIVGLLLVAADTPRLSVHTYGRFAMAPADWWVKVRVQPHAENRLLIIEADGDGQYRRTDIQLEGEQAPKVHQIWLKSLPEGCYIFTATLVGNGRVIATAHGPKLSVMGPMSEGGDPCA